MNRYTVVVNFKDVEYHINAKTGAQAKKIAIERAKKKKPVIDRSVNGTYYC